jgi:hypothetical protein
MEGLSHKIIKVHLYQSIRESKNIIKIGHDTTNFYTYFFLTHLFIIHLFCQFLDLETQAATFSFTSHILYHFLSKVWGLRLSKMQDKYTLIS